MSYYISRSGQQYGPYSHSDLQVYLAQGTILPTDMARSEDSNQWAPVSQWLNSRTPPPPAPPLATPVATMPYPYQGQSNTAPNMPPISPTTIPNQYQYQNQNVQPYPVPPPPGLHWGIVLLLTAVTLGLFGWIWSFVVANWVKKIDARSKAIPLLVLMIVLNVAATVLPFMGPDPQELALVALIPQFIALVAFLVAVFGMRSSIVNYYNTVQPIGLRLSGVMTFFFTIIYFQYKFNEITAQQTRSSGQPLPVLR